MATYYLLDSEGKPQPIELADLMKQEKLVLDADLQTVKGSSETKVRNLETELATAKARADELLNRAVTAESASEDVKKQLDTLKSISERVPTLESELNALKEKHSAAETQLLTTRRNSLIEKYALDGEKKTQIESMTAEELTSAEKAAALFGNPPSRQSQQNYDRNPNRSRNQEWDETNGIADLREGMKEIRTVGANSAE